MSACGFQLRDQAALPPAFAHTHIEGVSPYDDFTIKLERALQAGGIEIAPADRATAILRIVDRRRGRRVLSVDADGKVREVEIYTIIRFKVTGKDGALILDEQSLTATRDFLFDETNVLGNASEAELLYQDMEDELVRLMLYRLQAAA
jgi:LPS-assembly lipoprotein